MLMPLGVYVRQGSRILQRITGDDRWNRALRCTVFLMGGFVSAAASLAHTPLPLPLSLLCAGLGGWDSLCLGLGAASGYWLFWQQAGYPGMIWVMAGLLLSLTAMTKLPRRFPLLLPALSGVTVAVTGLIFRFAGLPSPELPLFIMQIALAIGAGLVFTVVLCRRDPVMDWLACGLGVLALSQVAIFPGFSLGMVAVGMLSVAAPFPALALAGLAVDLSGICAAPVTAVACLTFFLRLIPQLKRWVCHIAAAGIYLIVAPLCGVWELMPALPLFVGGILGILLPRQTPIAHRRGETGVAQVRLEMASEVMAQSEQLLSEIGEPPIDESALIQKAADRACITCPCRQNCADREQAMSMTPSVLHRPLVGVEDVPLSCRKRGRLLLELRRVQEQLRAIRADRDRQREYRSAMIQQYRFLSSYLQDLADQLPRRADKLEKRFTPEVSISSAGLEISNGDKCMSFAGPENQYYVLLCDGMGTGIGAEEESRQAANLLKRLLCAGYPAQYALRSLNSLCALRNRPGAVTIDLARIDLGSGNAELYKWGAAPSYLLQKHTIEKIGTAGPPPGLSVTDNRETAEKLSLRRGQTLVLLSDGIDGEAALRRCEDLAKLPTGELAARIMRDGRGQDDATAVVIRLHHWPSST